MFSDLPPDLEKQRAEEEAAQERKENGGEDVVKPPTTLEKITALKEKLIRVHTQLEKGKLEKELEALQIQWDEERTVEINTKLASGIPRYGPEAATLKEELEVIKAREEKRKEREEKRKNGKEEDSKTKSGKSTTNSAREKKKDTTKTKLTENLAPKTETQIKLDKLKERKRMIDDSEKEKNRALHGHGRHTACMAESALPFVPGSSFSKGGNGPSTSRANTASRLVSMVYKSVSPP